MKRTLLISDLHCGSHVSVMHPNSRISTEGGRISVQGMTPIQNILWKLWKKMCKSEPFDRVVVNGDLVDGKQEKSGSVGLWTVDLDCQAECAALLLRMIPLKRGGEIDIVGGTGYHVKRNPGMDKYVAIKINEMNDGILHKIRANYQGLEYILESDGQQFHVTHSIGGGVYLGTAQDKEINFNLLYGYNFDGLIRAHKHHFRFGKSVDTWCVITPCWKGRDNYEVVNGLKWYGNFGWVVLETDKGGKWEMLEHVVKPKFKEDMRKVTIK